MVKKMFREDYLKKCQEEVSLAYRKGEDGIPKIAQYIYDAMYRFNSHERLFDICVGLELNVIRTFDNHIVNILNTNEYMMASGASVEETWATNESINLRRLMKNYLKLSNYMKQNRKHDLTAIENMVVVPNLHGRRSKRGQINLASFYEYYR